MTPPTVMILISPHEPAQVKLAIALKKSLNKVGIKATDPQTSRQWIEQQSERNAEMTITRVDPKLVFDLSGMSTDSTGVCDPNDDYVVLGGFSQGRVQPISQASGIQEVAVGCPHTDLAIVSRTGAGDWTTWLHASIPTMRSWRLNQQQLIAAAAEYAALWLGRCYRTKRLIRLGKRTQCLGLSTAKTSTHQRISIVLRRTIERLRQKLRRVFRHEQRWQVGWLESNRNPGQPIKRIPSPGSVWFADPFLWRDQQNRIWILCEHFDDDGDQRGRIALFEIDSNHQAIPRGIVLEEPFHLSFPRLQEFQHRLYLTVESYQNRTVRLYTAETMTGPWQLCRTLLQGEPFIDPILVHHDDGYWYLFVNTTSVESLKREVAPELRLFYSKDLLAGDFCEHPESPLVISSRGGRNAGLIRHDNLYRVGQQTGYGGVYGESTALFRIDELSRTAYRESSLQRLPSGLQPEEFREKLKATHQHTLNSHAQFIVFDFIPS
jgi:hypothetical protein